MILLITFAVITIVAMLSQLVAYRRMYAYVHEQLHRKQNNFRPKVAVILPCKGIDPGFRENIRKLFAQLYSQSADDKSPHFEILFAVASEQDPCYPNCRRFKRNFLLYLHV